MHDRAVLPHRHAISAAEGGEGAEGFEACGEGGEALAELAVAAAEGAGGGFVELVEAAGELLDAALGFRQNGPAGKALQMDAGGGDAGAEVRGEPPLQDLDLSEQFVG